MSAWTKSPCVWLQHGDAQARLTISTLRGGDGERCLQFTIQQPEIPSRAEIFYYQTRDTLLQRQPDMCVITAWNYQTEIKTFSPGYQGEWKVCFPQ